MNTRFARSEPLAPNGQEFPMFSTSMTSTSRYTVFIQTKTPNGCSLWRVFCDNIADARKVLQSNWSRWEQMGNTHIALSNGYKPHNVPAAMVATGTRRNGRCIVATAPQTEMGVIAL